MNNTMKAFVYGLALVAFSIPVFSEEQKADRAVIPLSFPSKPAFVRAEIMMGGITVKGYEGKEIIVEATLRERPVIDGPQEIQIIRMDEKGSAVGSIFTQSAPQDPREKKRAEKAAGMKRLSVPTTGLEIEEERNVVTIRSEGWKQTVDVTIQVPYSTILNLNALNIGNIVVENVHGMIEAQGNSGSIVLKNVSGTIIANVAGEGNITATFAHIAQGKPMFFSSMGGDIDVTLPADARVSLRIRSRQGEIFHDFDIVLKASQKVEEIRDRESGNYRVSFNKYTYGIVNGGGPELTFNSFNGDIYIRKKK